MVPPVPEMHLLEGSIHGNHHYFLPRRWSLLSELLLFLRKVQIQTVHLESAGSNPVRDKALVHTDGIATFPFDDSFKQNVMLRLSHPSHLKLILPNFESEIDPTNQATVSCAVA